MQKYVITCFVLAVMTVNQIKANTKKRKDKEHNNQTDKVSFVSLLRGLKDQDESTYINLKDFDDGDVEIQDGRLTVVLPTSQIKGQRRKCKSKECRKRKDKSLTAMQSNNQTKTQSSLRNAIQHLKSRSGPIVIMKADDLKKDWCRTERMKRKVTEKGCLTKTIINNFCYGQCNSFFIPRQIRGKKDLENFQSCAYCQPTSHRWISVTLHCPKLIPPIRRKRILRVDKCSCSTGTPTIF